jgi:hypothetical protein
MEVDVIYSKLRTVTQCPLQDVNSAAIPYSGSPDDEPLSSEEVEALVEVWQISRTQTLRVFQVQRKC